MTCTHQCSHQACVDEDDIAHTPCPLCSEPIGHPVDDVSIWTDLGRVHDTCLDRISDALDAGRAAGTLARRLVG